MEKENGVWRTIRGRRIFIASGESLGEAMAKSGKFKREDIRQARASVSQIDNYNRTVKKSLKARQDAIKKMKNKEYRFEGTISSKNQAEKNRINENETDGINAKTRVERNWGKYSNTDRREIRHEKLQKKLADYKAKKQSNNKYFSSYEQALKESGHKIGNERSIQKEDLDKITNRTKDLIKEKEQGNNKVEKSDEEYSLYKRAKERPESIDPMTENSTDWEALEKKYSKRYEKESKEFKTAKEMDMEENTHTKYVKEMKANEKLSKDIKEQERRKELKKLGLTDKEIDMGFTTPEEAIKYETSFKNQFEQNVNMTGDVRLYSPRDIERMEEAGIRPMKDSYTGGGWEGVKSRQNLSTSEQAKAITSEMKKQFPDVKIARRSDVYSGGSSIDFNIMSSDKDLYISEKDIDNLSNEQVHNMLNDYNNGLTPYFDRWAEQNVSSYKNEHTYTINDVKRYMKEDVKNLKSRENQNVSGNEYYLSDYGKKVVSALNKEANSYTYDDSDGQVDYFNHGTYMDISIGKWNKPYQVNDVKAKVDAYKKRKGK